MSVLSLVCVVDCGMIGLNHQVIIVSCEEPAGSARTVEGKPRLTYTLTERSLQVI